LFKTEKFVYPMNMEKLKKYILLLILLYIASINFNLILKPLELVTGGTQGLAIIGHHLLKISPSLIILIINGIMLVLSFLFLRKETTLGTIIATFTYPLFVKTTTFFNQIILPSYFDWILAIIAGIICGFTCGYTYKLGFSTGGINVFSVILKKYFKIKISITNFIINTSIIIIGCFYFGFLKSFYSIMVVIINSFLIYSIMKKKSENTLILQR